MRKLSRSFKSAAALFRRIPHGNGGGRRRVFHIVHNGENRGAVPYRIVEVKLGLRRGTQAHLLRHLAAQVPRGGTQALQGVALCVFVAQDADVHLGVAQVICDLAAGDADEALHARVL